MEKNPTDESHIQPSLQRNEPQRVGSTDTGPTVLHWLVRDGELCEVVANHLRIDLNLVEGFVVVDANDAPNHLVHNDNVAEVCFHGLRLLTGGRREHPFLHAWTIKWSL
jgi:hypothetical protein